VAWQTPRTWVDGETVTVQMMNDHIRDELNALLTVPCARMQKAPSQNIANSGADVVILLDTNIFDTDGMVNIGANRLDIKTAGKYCVGGTIQWGGVADTAGYRDVKVKHTRGGTTTIIAENRGAPNIVSSPSVRCCGTIWDMQVNDFLQLTGANTATAATVPAAASGPLIAGSGLFAFRVGT